MIAEIYNLKEPEPIEYSKKVCVFGDDDFVMCIDKNSGKVLSSGYSIESKLLNDGHILAPITNINNDSNSNTSEEDEFSTIYQNLAIPAGLSYINYPNRRGQEPELAEASDRYTFKETLSDDVFDRLFDLIQAPTSKRSKNKSRKQEPMTLVGLDGGSAKKKRKYTKKNKQ